MVIVIQELHLQKRIAGDDDDDYDELCLWYD